MNEKTERLVAEINKEIAERHREIEETFQPWHKDPIRIARLYRWLELLDKAPIDVASFIENAVTYQRDYDDLMRMRRDRQRDREDDEMASGWR